MADSSLVRYSWAESAEEADLDVGSRWSQTKTRRTGSRGGVNQDLRMFDEDLALDRQEGGTEQVLSLIYGRPMTSGYIGNACVITWPRLPKNPCQKDAIMSKKSVQNIQKSQIGHIYEDWSERSWLKWAKVLRK